jgi:hypothetical protein
MVEWRHKAPGDRRGIPAELHAAVMSLPEADRSDRRRVNDAVRSRDEAGREGRIVWLYLHDYENGESRTVGEPGWLKVFACADVADRWFKQSDPEGVPGNTKWTAVQPKDRSGSTRSTRRPGPSVISIGSSSLPRATPNS